MRSVLHYTCMLVNLSNWAKQIEIPLIAIFEYSGGWEWRREPTDHFNLWLALEGQGIYAHAGKSWPFSSGSIFLFPPDMPTDGHMTSGLRLINFTAHIKATGEAAEMLTQLAQDATPVHLRHFIWASHLCRYLTETHYLKREEGSNLVAKGLELLLQSMVYERKLPKSDAAENAIIQTVERIRRNPAAAYSVAEMAALAQLSAAQFTRRFKGITGLSPNRFVVEERLARGELYLRQTNMSIQEIAVRLGYRDVYFFSRQFRRFRGISPTKVRWRSV